MGSSLSSKESKLEKDMAELDLGDERFFGLENFGNTCYCNSVLQSLYFCTPLKQLLMQQVAVGHAPLLPSPELIPGKCPETTILYQLGDLFTKVAGQKNVTGYLTPSDFLRTLREKNELFRGNMQQDAHEFFNFLINDISDTLVEVAKKVANEGDEKGSPTGANGAGAGVGALGENGCEPAAPIKTWMHTMFEGVLTNETRCLCCETISNRDETFVDLSLDIEQNSSVSACLRNFSKTETLTGKNKFYCETCCTLQEADKQMKLKKLPNVLTLHLKRFKYVEDIQSFSKLSHRVVFPHELKLPNMTKECVKEADERLYALFAVVVHIGRGPNHGHYVAIVKSRGRWLLFDDELVELVDESVLSQCFGVSNSGAGQNISTVKLEGFGGTFALKILNMKSSY